MQQFNKSFYFSILYTKWTVSF